MSLNFSSRFKNILGIASDEKNKAAEIFSKSSNTPQGYNPFLENGGSVFNKYIDYQRVLDRPDVSSKVKQLITDATGLYPTVAAKNTNNTPNTVIEASPTGLNATDLNKTSSNGGIVNAAEKYIGTPYVWGGESMAEGGMDCSGFVYNALKDAGYKVGRTTAQGYRSYGTTVDKANMQPGDLVFFGNNNNASHIGIYIGNGQMIHSSGGSKNTAANPGKGVSVTNVDYRNDFLEARRY